ncbi:porin family protein [Zunongwangia endophytica]|uniref:Porin family protein n=1 Tax=Zunongwangia endophytica TaxID=1808945 RepID=A0ABV8HCP9_9FLAO|nr:porin family protein [Zunongwangia endophytica]MDN3596747.1 porin family protein [Zunongwangia endophytica]
MKRYFILFIIIFSLKPAQAQLFSKEKVQQSVDIDNKRWSWGYFLGFNSYDFHFDYKNYDRSPRTGREIAVDRNIGFNVGLLGNLKLHKNVDLRLQPGVNFSSRGFYFTPGNGVTEDNRYREINSTYIHVPLLLKINTNRLNNFRPFIVGGVSYSTNLSSNEDNADDNYDGQFRMTTNNYNWEIGFGIDFYLYYFKFTPSIRGVFGLNDELVRDDNPNSIYTGNIDRMTTRAVFLNFTFQ